MKPLTLEETGIKTDDNEMCIKGIDELPIFSWNTKTKEFYVLGHKFDGINSIEDFINYIHNLDKENKSLQSQLKSKEEENQELKLELSGYRQAILEDKDMLGLKEENQSLKKQLEENQNPLKGIFAQVNDDTLLRDCGNMNAEINELKNQQKEFIKYMNDISEDLETEDVDDEEMKGYLIQRIDTFKEILSKYRSIIGDKE